MFKSLFNKLFGPDKKKSAKIKSIRRTFDTVVMRELDTRMVVHDERVYEVSDLEWIHGMVQVLLEEQLSKKMLEEARAARSSVPTVPPPPNYEQVVVSPQTITKKLKTYH